MFTLISACARMFCCLGAQNSKELDPNVEKKHSVLLASPPLTPGINGNISNVDRGEHPYSRTVPPINAVMKNLLQSHPGLTHDTHPQNKKHVRQHTRRAKNCIMLLPFSLMFMKEAFFKCAAK